VENLLKRKEFFDYIFIETDGLADPGPVAALFWVCCLRGMSTPIELEPFACSCVCVADHLRMLQLDEGLESVLYLDGIVTVVDAKHIIHHLNEEKPPVRLVSKNSVIL
jgi:G3E family GTPase